MSSWHKPLGIIGPCYRQHYLRNLEKLEVSRRHWESLWRSKWKRTNPFKSIHRGWRHRYIKSSCNRVTLSKLSGTYIQGMPKKMAYKVHRAQSVNLAVTLQVAQDFEKVITPSCKSRGRRFQGEGKRSPKQKRGDQKKKRGWLSNSTSRIDSDTLSDEDDTKLEESPR